MYLEILLFTSKWAQSIYLLQSIIVGAKHSFLLVQIVANSYNTINSNISYYIGTKWHFYSVLYTSSKVITSYQICKILKTPTPLMQNVWKMQNTYFDYLWRSIRVFVHVRVYFWPIMNFLQCIGENFSLKHLGCKRNDSKYILFVSNTRPEKFAQNWPSSGPRVWWISIFEVFCI